MVDYHQTAEYASFMEKLGWRTERVGKALAFLRPTVFGSLIKIQHPKENPTASQIEDLAKKRKPLLIKIEPTETPPPYAGFQPDSWPLLPTRTVIIDLRPDLGAILERVDKETRYAIRKAEKEGVEVKNFQDRREEFYRLFKETGKRQKFHVPSLNEIQLKTEAFGKTVWVVLASGAKYPAPLAGAYLLLTPKTAYYLHAGSTTAGQKLCAPSLVVWGCIKLAKEKNCQTLDLEGIFDPRFPRLNKNWQGFSHFKESFGGKTLEYPRPIIKYYARWLRILFAFFRF